MAVRFDADRGRYVSEFQQGGTRVFRRMPRGVTKAQAEEWEVKKRRALFDAGALGKRPSLTLAAALQLWVENNHRKNAKQAVSEAKQWATHVEGLALADAPEAARKAVSAWKSEGAKPATINRRLAALKAACKYAWKQDWHRENMSARIALLPERNQREIYLSKAEVRRLAAGMPDAEHKACTWLLAYCGPRINELLGHPKLPAGAARLHFPARTTKNSKARVVPVPLAAQRYLRFLPFSFDYWAYHRAFDAARAATGLAHVRPHDLRHTCASWLINEGVDLYTVAAILGDTLQQAQRYAHLADRTLERAMARLR